MAWLDLVLDNPQLFSCGMLSVAVIVASCKMIIAWAKKLHALSTANTVNLFSLNLCDYIPRNVLMPTGLVFNMFRSLSGY